MRTLIAISLMLITMTAFASHHHKKHSSPITMTVNTSTGSKIDRFADRMSKVYNFDRQEIYEFLTNTQPVTDIFKYFGKRPQKKYTPAEMEELKRLAQVRIENGVKFWNAHEDALARAEKEYGVPAEVIVGLIGIETSYGSYLGHFKEHQVLVTLAFYGSHRQDYFRTQLEDFLVLSREYSWDRTNIPCSYAGAVGIPQFMPDNMKPYAVDWNHDGQIDLMDPDDAIGSVASFLNQHGWVRNEPIATPTKNKVYHKTFVLRTLPGPSPTVWTKRQNFEVIRRYNPLDSYAMSIFILASKVKDIKQNQIEPINIDKVQILVPEEQTEAP